MKRIIASVLIIMIMLSMAGCCLKHEWLPATCTVPQTCAKCGETVGVPLQHIWLPATCTQPKTCSLCGATEGNPVHNFGGFETIKKASFFEEGEKQRVCTDCGFIEKASIPKVDPKEAVKKEAESYACGVAEVIFGVSIKKASCLSSSAKTTSITEENNKYVCKGDINIKGSNSQNYSFGDAYSVTVEIKSNGSLSIVDYEITMCGWDVKK